MPAMSAAQRFQAPMLARSDSCVALQVQAEVQSPVREEDLLVEAPTVQGVAACSGILVSGRHVGVTNLAGSPARWR